MIANELVEDARHLKKKYMFFFFKVDFKMAFDLVVWCYLKAVMKKKRIFQLCGVNELLNALLLCGVIRKISWINWDTICSEKESEGLRVRSIREFNLAILGKWFWRLKKEPRRL